MVRDRKSIVIKIIIAVLILSNIYQFYHLNQNKNKEQSRSHTYANQMIGRIQWIEKNLDSFIESASNQQWYQKNPYGPEEIHLSFIWHGILANSKDAAFLSNLIISIDSMSFGRPKIISSHYLEGKRDEMKDIDYILSTLSDNLYIINREFLQNDNDSFYLSEETIEKLETIHEIYSLLGNIIEVEDEMMIHRMDMEKIIEPFKTIDLTDRWELMDQTYKGDE